ncbi:hypothetical protein JCM10449v2_007613 [Rhodotorula kratochvilovae]
MAYDAPRPYRPQALTSPESYDSLRPPPSVTQWSAASGSGYASTAGSSERLDAPQGGAGARGAQMPRQGAPPAHPAVLQKREKGNKHEVLELGGTGVQRPKEDTRLARKRVILMIISGAIVSGIIALVVVGSKGLL